jgi:hypothetical protein
MMQPLVHLAYAPRGAGLMCALFYVAEGQDVYGWYTGACGNEMPANFFMLEHFYSTHATAFYRTHVNDVYAEWFLEFPPIEQRLDRPLPVPEAICQELERLQFVFAQEWLFYRDDPERGQEIAAYHDIGLAVQSANIRSQRLNKFNKDSAIWTFTAHGFDLNVLAHLSDYWQLDYKAE